MKRLNLMAAVFALLSFSTLTTSQTIQLNTGFDNTLTAQTIYPNPPVVSNQPDHYWMNIMSFPATTPTAGPAWVLHAPQAGWWPVLLPNSRWISATTTAASPPQNTFANPGYTVFRKCFCLQPGYKQPQLTFQVRADNQINGYLNSILNPVLNPSAGQFTSAAPLQSLPSNPNWFRTGRNCLYFYVEDQGGLMGFDLSGTVSALGLLPTPEMGMNGSYGSCSCASGPVPTNGGPRAAREAGDNEEEIIKEIVKIAEKRRSIRINDQKQ